MPAQDTIAPLRTFVQAMTNLVDQTHDERVLVREGRVLLQALIARDDWLPDVFAQAAPGVYRQYLLHCDPKERFSVVSFAWGPGARTPIHDHTVWGLVGVLRGRERCEEFDPRSNGQVVPCERSHLVEPGMIDVVSPTLGDWHVVSNDMPEATSVSIHVYGANIGAVRRHRFDPAGAGLQEFISGYSTAVVPNLWDRSVPTA